MERFAVSCVSGYSRPVSRFRGICFCIAVYGEHAFWAEWVFFFSAVLRVATERKKWCGTIYC